MKYISKYLVSIKCFPNYIMTHTKSINVSLTLEWRLMFTFPCFHKESTIISKGAKT